MYRTVSRRKRTPLKASKRKRMPSKKTESRAKGRNTKVQRRKQK